LANAISETFNDSTVDIYLIKDRVLSCAERLLRPRRVYSFISENVQSTEAISD